jgi:hypothetical protein
MLLTLELSTREPIRFETWDFSVLTNSYNTLISGTLSVWRRSSHAPRRHRQPRSLIITSLPIVARFPRRRIPHSYNFPDAVPRRVYPRREASHGRVR